MAENPEIRLRDVQLRLGGEKVLDIPSFILEKGQRLLLTGGNSTGKSTLLRLISGLSVPDAGTVEIDGHNLGDMPENDRDVYRGSHIGYIFQDLHLLPYLSAMDNILLPLKLSPERMARIEQANNTPEYEAYQLLAALGVEDLSMLKKAAVNLSRGIQQRVAIARALIGFPPLVIADEATASIDVTMQRQVFSLLQQSISKNRSTLIWVTHNQVEPEFFDQHWQMEDLNRALSGRVGL